MSLSESDPSFKAQYARLLTEQRVLQELAAIKPEHLPPSLRRPANAPPGTLPERTRPDVTGDPTELKVCIVGAGVAGLYTAHILGELGFQYDLFEASDRAGGRVYTHYFSDKVHDYYDIGTNHYRGVERQLILILTRCHEVSGYSYHETVCCISLQVRKILIDRKNF